ncbi:MAG: HD domain-containing phosphohydrolase [Thermodesulfovibrionales bacterium]
MLLKSNLVKHFKVDKELVVVFLLVAIAGTVFFFVSNQRAFLNFFYIPVLLSAYLLGKRHATYSAVFSIILISLIAFYYPSTFTFPVDSEFYKWFDIGTWGAFLVITAYYMGLLYEKKETANREIKKTYQGIIEMMSMIIDSADKAGQSHSYRVSVISGMIARDMGLSELWVENIRIAALLHDLGKLDVGSEVLDKLSKLPCGEYDNMQIRTTRGPDTLEPMCGKILDIMPLILYHGEKFDGSGNLSMAGDDIPLGARIIAVADAYDSLLYNPQSRKALTSPEAKQEIIKLSTAHFDPRVTKAFSSILPSLEVGAPFLTAGGRSQPAESSH